MHLQQNLQLHLQTGPRPYPLFHENVEASQGRYFAKYRRGERTIGGLES